MASGQGFFGPLHNKMRSAVVVSLKLMTPKTQVTNEARLPAPDPMA